MTKVQIVQALVDYFNIDISQYGESVTEENLGKILQDYDFVQGAYLWYWWRFISLGGVVRAMGELCEDNW